MRLCHILGLIENNIGLSTGEGHLTAAENLPDNLALHLTEVVDSPLYRSAPVVS